MNEQLPHYSLRYVTSKGEEKDYKISRPFDLLKDDKGLNVGIVAYCYGKGIRSFRHERILKMEPTKIRL
jgi:hypothetical protein